MSREFLTEAQLAERWSISPQTLRWWRCKGLGLPYVKLGSAVRYRMKDVQDHEIKQTQGEVDGQGNSRQKKD